MRGLWVRLPPLALSGRVLRGRFFGDAFCFLRDEFAPTVRSARLGCSVMLSLPIDGSLLAMIQATAPTTAPTTDVRDIVVSNNTFGPREITLLMQSIAEDYQQFGVMRDGVAELEARED